MCQLKTLRSVESNAVDGRCASCHSCRGFRSVGLKKTTNTIEQDRIRTEWLVDVLPFGVQTHTEHKRAVDRTGESLNELYLHKQTNLSSEDL